jgi:hypothetical protein
LHPDPIFPAIQHLPKKPSIPSRLKDNIRKVLGFTAPKQMAAHHIVEKLDNPLALEILEEAGIHADEAANGVLLKRQAIVNEYAAKGQADWLDGLGPLHEGRHSEAYSQAVLERLTLVRGQPADVIRNELQKIAQELIDGTFPW